MVNQLKIGFLAYGKANKFIRTNKLSWLYLIPFFINILLFVAAMTGAGLLTEGATGWFLDLFGLEKGGEYYEFVGAFVWWFFYIVIKLVSWIILHFISGGLMLIILSPLLAYLSERTEQILKGNNYPFNLSQFIKDVFRGVLIATRDTILQLLFMLFLLLFSLIPVIGWLSPFFMFIIGAYYYGFSFIDYTCERKRLTLKQSIHFMRNNKGLAISNGTIFSIVIMIPWIGGVLAGFVAVTSVVAATLSVYEAEDKKLLKLR
ncbi:MAG: EI24 domain-containing protein [Flavobacteriales bacterium]|nr:EI24 domain-containing protein [Flavobacteriales bacterium]